MWPETANGYVSALSDVTLGIGFENGIFDFFFFISANIMIVSHRQHSFSTEAEVLFSSAISKETKQTRVGYEHISIHSLGHKKLV